MAAIQKRSPFKVGAISHDAKTDGWSAGRYDETRAQEAPGLPLLVRSSIAGRELRHHFAWIKYISPWRTDGMSMAAQYPVSHLPRIINSTPRGYYGTRVRPIMSNYPRTSNQGGMQAQPRFDKASAIKQNSYRPPTY